jgi:glucosamine kinase
MAVENGYSIIGIDGGGTRTRGILYNDGKILAKSGSGTTRVGAVGVGESCERLLNVIADLCTQAAIDSSEIDAVVIGLAGVWLDEEKRRSTQLMKTLARTQKMVLNDIIVISDAELAVEGAFGGDNGIVLIVGTGSIAIGKTSKDKLVRCGGWGIELDDEGSGAWIGKEGLTAIARALDGRGKKTALTGLFAEMYPNINLDEPRSIVKAYSDRTFEYHLLTPVVMKCAEDGDPVCLEIIHRASYHLMELLEAILKQYKAGNVPVAMLGGVIEADTLLSRMLDDAIASHKRFKRVKPKGSALDGAITLGLNLIDQME